MGEIKELSMLDAFKALSEIDEEFTEIPVRKHKVVDEGFSVNLNDSNQVKAAVDQLDKEDDEVTLEVIDANADTVDHLKNKKDYVGQMIVKCNVCQAPRFLDAEELEASEEDPDIVNVEDECPNCHSEGKGYTVVGQVGAVTKEEAEEVAQVENDAKDSDEASFENDVEEEQSEATNEQEAAEETNEDEDVEIEEPEEKDFNETDAEDDTEDLDLPPLGSSEDEEETEEKKEVEEDLDEEENVEEVEEVAEPESDLQAKDFTISELTPFVLEAEDKEISISDGEKQVFDGVISDIPNNMTDDKIVSLVTDKLIINIDNKEEVNDNSIALKDLLNIISIDGVKELSIIEVNSDEEVINFASDENNELAKEDLLKDLGKYADALVSSIEFVSKVELTIDSEEELEEVETDELTVEESLVKDIFKANNLKEYKVNNIACNEYWINEAIQSKEDLDIIYEEYVIKTRDKNLIEKFKKVTGFKDVLDEAKEEFADKYINVEPDSDDLDFIEYAEEHPADENDNLVKEAKSVCPKCGREVCECNKVQEELTPGEKVRRALKQMDAVNESLKSLKEDVVEVIDDPDDARYEDENGAGTVVDTDATSNIINEVSTPVSNKVLADLIIDEKEAIDGYNKAIDELKANDEATEKTEEVLKHIEDEELEHIEELSKVVAGQEDEIVTEALTAKSNNKQINDLADAIDKELSKQIENVQVVTDDAYKGQIGVLFTTEEDRKKYKDSIIKILDSLGAKANKIEDVQEKAEDVEYFGITFDDIQITVGKSEISESKQNVKHFKNRKELTKAIIECKNNNRPYIIKRSLTEGFRYDLLTDDFIEEPDEEESETEVEKEEFNTKQFDQELNEYFKQTYSESVIYNTKNGSKDTEGNIVLEGLITLDNQDTEVKFLLQPSKVMNEELKQETTVYKVSNNLSEEVFEFSF